MAILMKKINKNRRRRYKKRKKPRPIIRITSDHVELISAIGVYAILLIDIVWFIMTIFGILTH